MRFKPNPVMLALLTAPIIACSTFYAYAATIDAWTPEANDAQVGATTVTNRSETLEGNPRFAPGQTGAVNTTLGQVTIASGSDYLNQDRLNPGPQNAAVLVPDPVTGGQITFQVYDSSRLVALEPITGATAVPDIQNVNDGQYIDARVANIGSGGVLDINLGQPNAAASAASNGWQMAAKQTTLFDVTDGGAVNWESNNRIGFTGSAAALVNGVAQQSYDVTNLATYNGTFNVQTLDGNSTAFTVTNASQLQAYNNWLIDRLKAGALDKNTYLTEFNKALTTRTGTIVYNVFATAPDEVTQPIGSRIVINATGAGSRVNLATGKTLEVTGATGGAIHASDGAEAIIDGTLASRGTFLNSGTALALDNNSRGTNNGVINSGFLNSTAGTVNGAPSFGTDAVTVNSGSRFDNTGIVNLATSGSSAPNGVAGINLGDNSQATNSGNINVGVASTSSRGTTSGVLLTRASSAFTNSATGNIYLGRGPQNALSDSVADTTLNQSGLTSGIALVADGVAINQGTITLGSRVQNGAGMSVSGAAAATLQNQGVIDVNGAASRIPRENIGMSVLNSDGNIENSGTINLNGVNGTGIKVVATAGNRSQASSTGVINVAGGADPSSGTRNFGIWVEGQGSGESAATVDGAINLSGDGAIGVHARGNATVTVSPDAVQRFAQGSNQIAFFAYGPNANINVADNNAFDVTTRGSTLFRLEQGADFDGSDLTLGVSGEGAVGVIGTGGGGTRINTQNAEINVSGNGATGVIIEGGASGIIDQATRIDLSGRNAIGALADGQKHTLAGSNSGSPSAATSLNSAAELNSAQEGIVGYIARNRASLTNTGNIAFTGAGTTGLRVESGASGTNSGNITIADGGSGIIVDSNGSALTTTATNTGVINVNGGSSTARSRGVTASGARAVANLNGGSFNLNGVGALGAEAINGGRVNVSAASTPQFNNRDQIAYRAAGRGSAIDSASNALSITTAGSTGYRIDDGAALRFSSANTLTTAADGSTGVIISGNGSTLASGNSRLQVNGADSHGVRVEGGASATLDAASQLILNGDRAVGVLVDNLRTDLSNALDGSTAASSVINNAVIGGGGTGVIAFDIANGATLRNTGQVDLTGSNTIGIRTRSGSTLVNDGTVNVANGTGMDISGGGTTLAKGGTINVGSGIAGVRISDGAQLALTGSDTLITSGGAAHGVLLDSGAAGFTASDARLNVTGSGNGIENRAGLQQVSLNNLTIDVTNGSGIRTAVPFDPASTVTVNVRGSGSGLTIANADGGVTGGDLSLGSGYVFNVDGAGGTGIRANTTGTINSAATVNINSRDGGSALVSSTARTIIHSGTFTSASLTSPVVDLRGGQTLFENVGTIITATPDSVAVAGSNASDVVLLTRGEIRGDINPGGGSDRFQWTGGVLDGSLTMGNDVNNVADIRGVDLSKTRHLTAGSATGNTLTLSDVSWRGGSFAADDLNKGVNLGGGWSTINFNNSAWTLTDNLQLAHSMVNIGSGSVLYAGNGVNPTIAGGSDRSVAVNNAGIIDLTNGSDVPGNRLTINGDLNSLGGQAKLATRLNAGGAVANQFSDKLLVAGNASQGTTLLDVRLNAASTGNLTDLNRNSAIDADEGITLAQVAGSARSDSFALRNGYLAAGPWKYELYSFSPGNSDAAQRQVSGAADGNFWDYRLANSYVCQGEESCAPVLRNGAFSVGDNARIAVISQVPAYVSAPVGLAYYSAAIVDDLHKRLGELRHQQTLPAGDGGELFVRYIGANLTYNTDRSFRDFGYDMDIDYSAVQIGGNLIRLDGEQDSLRGGVAFTRGNTRLRPDAADGFSSTTFDSDSLAFYGTWQRNNGFYLDGVLSFDRHRGETDIAQQREVANIKGHGWNASLEGGYPWLFANGVRLEPQAQLMVMQLDMSNFTDKTNTKVSYDRYNQTIGRLGARLDRSWSDDSLRQYTPYLRANYYRGWGKDAKTRISAADNDRLGNTFGSGGFGQMAEAGAGGTVTFKNAVSLYTEVDYRHELDGNGAKGWRYNVGVRWQF